jgi:hypothetical protein
MTRETDTAATFLGAWHGIEAHHGRRFRSHPDIAYVGGNNVVKDRCGPILGPGTAAGGPVPLL